MTNASIHAILLIGFGLGNIPIKEKDLLTFIQKAEKKGKTVFLTTHYMEEAEKLCKTIGIINHGRIVRIGEKQQVLRDKSLEAVFLEVTGLE